MIQIPLGRAALPLTASTSSPTATCAKAKRCQELRG
jgi:hypothetical protein